MSDHLTARPLVRQINKKKFFPFFFSCLTAGSISCLYVSPPPFLPTPKGTCNERNFPRFLHKSVRHKSLTLPFEPFRLLLRIRGDIRNRKTIPRLVESGTRQGCLVLASFSTNKSIVVVHYIPGLFFAKWAL